MSKYYITNNHYYPNSYEMGISRNYNSKSPPFNSAIYPSQPQPEYINTNLLHYNPYSREAHYLRKLEDLFWKGYENTFVVTHSKNTSRFDKGDKSRYLAQNYNSRCNQCGHKYEDEGARQKVAAHVQTGNFNCYLIDVCRSCNSSGSGEFIAHNPFRFKDEGKPRRSGYYNKQSQEVRQTVNNYRKGVRNTKNVR